MEEIGDVQYCVTTLIDLQGFSSHLEIAAYDMRTNIGQQAIKRLQILEDSLKLVKTEGVRAKQYHPTRLHLQRLNDSLFVAMDLPEFLKPSIGSTIKKGFSAESLNTFFTKEEMDDEQSFEKAYRTKIQDSIKDLILYVGLVARIHAYINRKESKEFYPGAKSVMATGFRKPFFTDGSTEDYFSANFSLSNAYIAEGLLKGTNLYIDNNILQMLSNNPYALNLIRYASFSPTESQFNPFEKYEDLFFIPRDYVLTDAIEVEMFRRKFTFRAMDPNSLAYLQTIHAIEKQLHGEAPMLAAGPFKSLFISIQKGMPEDDLKNKKMSLSWIHAIRNDLTYNIEHYPEYVHTGKISDYEDKINRLKFFI